MKKVLSLLEIVLLLTSIFLASESLCRAASPYPEIKQLTDNDFNDCLGSGRNSHDNVLDRQGTNLVYSTWYSDNDVQIYVMKTSDSPGQEKALTSSAGTNNFGSICADGSRIAFGSNRKDPNDRYYSYEVYVMSTSGIPGDEIPVTDDSLIDNDPVLSGNGGIIAWHSSSSESSGWKIRIAEVSDPNNIIVHDLATGSGDVFYPSLTYDGSAISFYDRGTQDIYYVRTDGSGLRDLTNSPEIEYNNAISGDGTKVAFNRVVDGQLEILIYDISLDKETRLTYNSADDILGGIDGDGSTVVYTRDGHIFMHDLSFETQLTDGSYDDRTVRISGDGSTVVFESNRDGSDYDIYMVHTYARATEWIKYPENPLNLGSGQLSRPWVIYAEGMYKMWYTVLDPVGTAEMIYFADSSDGFSWVTHGAVLAGGSWDVRVLKPVVLYDGTIYKMWYLGANAVNSPLQKVGYATSSDGVTWFKHTGPVLVPGGNGGWDDFTISSITVLFDGTNYLMWYSAEDYSAGTTRMGVATSTSGISWTKYSGNPVLAPISSSWESGHIWAGPVFKSGDHYEMWYTGQTRDYPGRIGLATSSDGFSWQRYEKNPELDNGPPGSWDCLTIISSCVVEKGGNLLLWYYASDGETVRIGLALMVMRLPAGAWYQPGHTYEDTETILQKIDVDSETLGDQQVICASPGQTISVSYTFQIWSSGGSSIIKQAWFAYSWASSWPPWDAYTPLYDGGSGGYYPGFTKTDSFTITIPTTPGKYDIWFCTEAHYSMNLALEGLTEPPDMPPHAVVIVTCALAPPLTLTFDPSSTSLSPINTAATLKVYLTDDNDNPVQGIAVGFTSDPTLTIPSGTTDSLGYVTVSVAGTTPNVYTITATASTPFGPVTADWQLVLYDPSGGFATGGGWIYSPAGAYTADLSLEGKGTFGFVSKYQKVATVPSGNTEFIFHMADFRFKSTSYEWLVVAGTKAQLKGQGTFNGAGNYGFMLTAEDGGKTGTDTFRIKIWDIGTGDIIYDNGAQTPIDGGSIIIHK